MGEINSCVKWQLYQEKWRWMSENSEWLWSYLSALESADHLGIRPCDWLKVIVIKKYWEFFFLSIESGSQLAWLQWCILLSKMALSTTFWLVRAVVTPVLVVVWWALSFFLLEIRMDSTALWVYQGPGGWGRPRLKPVWYLLIFKLQFSNL